MAKIYWVLLITLVTAQGLTSASCSNDGDPPAPWRVSWVATAGADGVSGADCMAAFSDGSSVIAADYTRGIVFGASEPKETELTIDDPWRHVYIARYASDGAFSWVTEIICQSSILPNGLAALDNGSIVVTGWFKGYAVFGENETNETILTPNGWFEGPPEFPADIFLAMYNADGSLAWARAVGGTGGEAGNDVVGLPDGSCLVTGSFSNEATFGAGEIGEQTLVASQPDDSDFFLARYAQEGNLLWAIGAGGATFDRGKDVALLDQDSLVVTGSFATSTTFGLGEENETTLVSGSEDYLNLFVARYNLDGTLQWAKGVYGESTIHGIAVASRSDGGIYLTGIFKVAGATFGMDEDNETSLATDRSQSMFVASYGADGSFLWAVQDDGVTDDDDAHPMSMDVLPDGSACISGVFHGDTWFGQLGGEAVEVVSNGKSDSIILNYDEDGNLPWVITIGGPSEIEFDYAPDVAVVDGGSILVGGVFSGKAAFAKEAHNPQTRTASLWGDAYILRLDPEHQ